MYMYFMFAAGPLSLNTNARLVQGEVKLLHLQSWYLDDSCKHCALGGGLCDGGCC